MYFNKYGLKVYYEYNLGNKESEIADNLFLNVL